MAESMQGLKRTHRCGELSAANVGETVTIMGWVQKNRNKGGLVFVDVRDRSGIIQVVCEEGKTDPALLEKAASLRSEYVVAIVGEVAKRSGAVNEKIATGEIEVIPSELRILSESLTPPFQVEENCKTKEEVRLKYRYLDLRRPDIQRNLMMKSRVMTLTRQFFTEEGFLEIETPMLGKTTPEGARDYLVPSRIHPGCFYGLPQSPQLYKQLLMCSGFDRYIQIARCFRDEDLRADRQPEFTQIDMELSFVDVDDVIDVNERYLAKLFKEVLDVDVQLPIQRMTWQEAMDRFGSDKPDLRFGMELTDVTDVVKGCGFGVFTGAIENGGTVRGINAKGQGAMPRKKIDKLTAFVKDYGAKGLAYIAIHEDGTVKSSFAKFMSEEEMDALIKAMDGQPGDLLLFAADKNKVVWDSLGALRVELANSLIFWTRTNTVSYGSQNSRSSSGAMSRAVISPCIIRSPCRWKRICRSSIKESSARSAQKLTISSSTETRSAAEASESIRMTFRRRCSRRSDLQKSRLTASSVSFLKHSSTECRRTQDSPTDWTVLSCSWQNRTASAT